MKIALLGYGKMGKLVEQAALDNGHEVIAKFSRQLGTAQSRMHDIAQADLVIDFSQPSCVMPHLELCLSFNKPLVIGTTGWENQLNQAQDLVNRFEGSCLHAPNFSIGAYLFQQIAFFAASLFQPFPEYDVCGIEYHHRQKLDAPSGTSKALTKQILEQMPRLDNLNFTSVRCGHIPGTHTIHFDSSVDTITLTHEARNRQGFASGAIKAAEWLVSRKGFFSIEDMMQSYLTQEINEHAT
jgi:4-hydroxy-tetrahydrodipicolinate reductase